MFEEFLRQTNQCQAVSKLKIFFYLTRWNFKCACVCMWFWHIDRCVDNAGAADGDLTFKNHCHCDLLSIQKTVASHFDSAKQMNARVFLGAHKICWAKCMRFHIESTCTWQHEGMEVAGMQKRKITKKHNNLIRDNFKSQMLKSNKIHSCLLLSLDYSPSLWLSLCTGSWALIKLTNTYTKNGFSYSFWQESKKRHTSGT